jgi:hypothetical protein
MYDLLNRKKISSHMSKVGNIEFLRRFNTCIVNAKTSESRLRILHTALASYSVMIFDLTEPK